MFCLVILLGHHRLCSHFAAGPLGKAQWSSSSCSLSSSGLPWQAAAWWLVDRAHQVCLKAYEFYKARDILYIRSLDVIEGSLEVKLATIWTDEKKSRAEAERRERLEERRSEKRGVRRKKMQMREKVGKSRNTVSFQWFVAREGRKVGSLKRRVRSQLARWEMKNCTPLWREAHFEVKMYKAHHGRTTFGSCDVKKVHAVAARSTFRSENVQSTPCSDHFWKLRCRKSARCCGAKHISKWTCTKHLSLAPLLEVQKSKKCTPLWRETHFEVKMYTTLGVRTTFGGSDVVSRGRRKGFCTCSKVSKTWGFCSISKSDGRHGTFEEDLQRCIFRGRRSTKDMFMRDVRSSGRWFPERGCILEYQMCRFAKMILRDRCSTSYDLASISRGRRSTLDRWTGKIAKLIGTRLSALHSTLHFWRKSRKIVFFDVVKFINWRSLAELLCVGCCQVHKNEEVSQNCFVLDVVTFKN